MAGLKEESSFSFRAFRRMGRVSLELPDGSSLSGRGLVSAIRRNTGEPGGSRHPLGVLPRPLYRFVGWLPGLEDASGGVLTQAGQSYTVLDGRRVLLGDREVCVRALLERRNGCAE